MRINSRFKEYYDKGQQWAVPESIVFNRNVVNAQKDCLNPKDQLWGSWWGQFLIGFCGKIYSGMLMEEHDEYNYRTGKYDIHFSKHICYTLEEFEVVVRGWMNRKLDSEKKRRFSPFFNVVEDNTPFIEENAPVFISYDGTTVFHTLNKYKSKSVAPEVFTLSDFEFDRIKPANIAYQEIESYITGTLFVEHKEVPEMPNKVKIESHGFDNKSFKR